MKTTIELDDALAAQVKQRAAREGVTMRAFVEQALRARLLPQPRGRKRFRLELPIVEGTAPPAVDISDRRSLYDLMEGRK
jgi:hypothetical protein